MRVLVVSTWFPSTERPDLAPFNIAHARAVARTHDVRMVHARLDRTGDPVADEVAGLPMTRLPVSPRDPLGAARAVAALRRLAADADVVHTMAFSTLGVLAPLYPAIGRRWVHTEHWNGVTDPTAVPGIWPKVAFGRHLLRLPRRVTAVTSDLADAMAPFARAGATGVVPCVIDDSFEAAPQPDRSPVRLVAVGALVERKRPLLALDTVRLLADDGLPVRLTWVGDGPQRDEAVRHAQRLGIADSVEFAGFVAPDKVAGYVRAANLFFLPTAQENFLTAAAEALACGRPVVLPDTGGFTDYVTDANGVIAATDDARSLADAVRLAVRRLVDTPPEQIRATVVPRFAASTVAASFDEIYHSLER